MVKKTLVLFIFFVYSIIVCVPFSAAIDLQTLINNAPEGGVVDLTPYSVISIGGNINVLKQLTIKSNKSTIINGGGHLLIGAEPVSFENIRFYGLTDTIKLNRNIDVFFRGCVFEDNRGDVINSCDGANHLGFVNCSFTNNIGHVISVLDGGLLEINESSFKNNHAGSTYTDDFGSCIYSFDSNVSIIMTGFEQNNAGRGGCLYVNNHDMDTGLSISGCDVVDNSADVCGGFLFLNGLKNYLVSVSGSNFRDNHINVNSPNDLLGGCGGVFMTTNNYTVLLSNNNFHDNRATIGSVAVAHGYCNSNYIIDGSNGFSDRDGAMLTGFVNKDSDNTFDWRT